MKQNVVPPTAKYLIVMRATGTLSFLHLRKNKTIWDICVGTDSTPVTLENSFVMAASVSEAYLIIDELGGCALDLD